jgi:nucleotide-binding universal stress UspA family protein
MFHMADPAPQLRDIGLILVPTDFSAGSAYALTAAIDLAHVLKATIEVFHVDPDPSNAGAAAENILPVRLLFESAAAETRRRLDRVALDVEDAGVSCTAASQFGRSARAIVEHARRRAAGLIVLGHHRRRTLRNVLWGSIAERVVRAAPCPVLVIPAPVAGRRKRPGARARTRP